MNYIVFDLEFNMFFKFKEGDEANRNLKSEIIQIGAVKLSDNLETVDSFEMMVKPEVYRRLNPYVRKKTKINSEQISRGTPFREGIKRFCAWAGDGVLCSWGQDDILGLRDNCRYFEAGVLNFDRFIDIQRIYMQKKELSNQPSLESAVEELEIQAAAPFHDALSDAVYTAAVFKEVYDFSAEAIVNWEKDRDDDGEKIAALKGIIAETALCCPDCGRDIHKDSEVRKGRKYFAFGYCPVCRRQVRNASKIVRREGVFRIVSKNSVLLDKENN